MAAAFGGWLGGRRTLSGRGVAESRLPRLQAAAPATTQLEWHRGASVLMLLTTFLFLFGFMVAEYLAAAFGVASQAVLGLTLVAAFTWLGTVLWRFR